MGLVRRVVARPGQMLMHSPDVNLDFGVND